MFSLVAIAFARNLFGGLLGERRRGREKMRGRETSPVIGFDRWLAASTSLSDAGGEKRDEKQRLEREEGKRMKKL